MTAFYFRSNITLLLSFIMFNARDKCIQMHQKRRHYKEVNERSLIVARLDILPTAYAALCIYYILHTLHFAHFAHHYTGL